MRQGILYPYMPLMHRIFEQSTLPEKLTFSPLRMDGWKMKLPFGKAIFSEATLVLGRVAVHILVVSPTNSSSQKCPPPSPRHTKKNTHTHTHFFFFGGGKIFPHQKHKFTMELTEQKLLQVLVQKRPNLPKEATKDHSNPP